VATDAELGQEKENANARDVGGYDFLHCEPYIKKTNAYERAAEIHYKLQTERFEEDAAK
jgi:hypothetical protein